MWCCITQQGTRGQLQQRIAGHATEQNNQREAWLAFRMGMWLDFLNSPFDFFILIGLNGVQKWQLVLPKSLYLMETRDTKKRKLTRKIMWFCQLDGANRPRDFWYPKYFFPFQKMKHYERTLDVPLGSEWNSLTFNGDINKPRIITRSSQETEPIWWNTAVLEH